MAGHLGKSSCRVAAHGDHENGSPVSEQTITNAAYFQSRASCRRAAPETMKMGSGRARIAVVPWSGSRSKPTWCLEPAEQADRGSVTNPQLSPPTIGEHAGETVQSHRCLPGRGRSVFRHSPSVMTHLPHCSLCCWSRGKGGFVRRLRIDFQGRSDKSSGANSIV